MSAQEHLQKAVEYDQCGRRLEALKLYEGGIRELLAICKNEVDTQRKKHFQTKIKEYLDRAENIKKEIEKASTLGEIVDRTHIIEGGTGYSYTRIFEKYFDNKVHEIQIDEPYLKDPYQLINLVKFLELAVKCCPNLKYVKLTTIKDVRTSSEQTHAIQELVRDLKNRNLTMQIEFSQHLHDRQIILSNGYIVKIGRGLHYFKPTNSKYALGFHDFDLRETENAEKQMWTYSNACNNKE